MKKTTKSYPVAPDSVFVWRGFMAPPPYSYTNFVTFLGNIFVPACALLQPKVGLRAYLPTLVPQSNKPVAVPDQTALMFWENTQSHNLANEALAVRIYQNLHGEVYDMKKSSLPENPIKLPITMADFVAEQPYFLIDLPADWMLGKTHHLVTSRPIAVSSMDFLVSVYQWCSSFKSNFSENIDAALVCCGNDYAVAWVHSKDDSADLTNIFADFTKFSDLQLNISPKRTVLSGGLWSNWAGIDLTKVENISLNIQLERPVKTVPKK